MTDSDKTRWLLRASGRRGCEGARCEVDWEALASGKAARGWPGQEAGPAASDQRLSANHQHPLSVPSHPSDSPS